MTTHAKEKTMALAQKADVTSANAPTIDQKLARKFFHDMLHIRRFEEKAGQLYGMGLIGGFCHLYIGQEAVVVGLQAAMRAQDTVVTSYRDHGHMLAADMDGGGVMAELTGRIGGYSKGKGGSMHMFSREKNFYGGHGIVGAQVPIGTGLAFAHKFKNDGGVCLTYMGDGAANQGQFFESMNMAALWKLPVLYIIENNRYGMGTSQERHAAGELYKRGEPFGIPGRQVDGMDVMKVFEAGQEALGHIRSGKGPMVLEMMTYRYRGHSMSDPAKYRTKEEVDKFRDGQDPIENFRSYAVTNGLIAEDEMKAIEKDVREKVTIAAEFAQQSPEPDAAELWTDVLKD
ncbi:MAG: pyruvate dehydrogenase (acetyl-transferring) E1 component subunit alpha [Alphaproteobacteria bacterium]|nr:pyruvate dehydrogenase (acetyl-transferring) E1 component subunit alpha [Alphaproteobacteria bacterium]NDC56609.1 pyruvate dehydrogenase (acetyl-transferring) E1 component subunit alpha [Alphaproteobacteria bacterium]